MGKLCLLIYLLGSRISLARNNNRECGTYLLLFPFITTTRPSFQIRPPGLNGKSAISPSEFPSIRKGTLNLAGSFGAVSKFVSKNARTIGSCVW